MIKLRIKNKNGDVLYERDDEYYVRLNREDYAYISDALSDVGSDIVYVDIDCNIDDNPFMVYSYHSVMRGGKTVIENKIKKVLKEYEKQLSALPAYHPAAHAASRMREVGDLDENDGYDGYDSRDGYDGHDISKAHTASRMRENDGHDGDDGHDGHDIPKAHTASRMREDDGRNEDDSHDENDSHGNHDDYDSHDISLPDHKFEEELRKDILATLPGTYVGCGKHDECKRQSECEGDLEQDAEKDVRTSEDPKHTQLLKDFISYLNTYTSWASLLDDLGFYNKSKDSQELIEKFYRTRAITKSIRNSYERHERNLRQPWKR